MPELPEVERYRRYLRESVLDQPIRKVEAFNEGRMLPGGLERLQQVMEGQRLTHFDRIGKYLFPHLDNGTVMLWHFGMSGRPVFYHESADIPKYERIRFSFDDGYRLAFSSLRKFSRLEVGESVAAFQQAKKLGQDAMEISQEDFVTALSRKKTRIKPALLEQKHFAGVGNWIADEMLFQANIHPEVRCQEVGELGLRHLYLAMQEILQTAISHEADYNTFPKHFMVISRWGEAEGCPRCGGELTKLVVGGRGTYICETCLASTIDFHQNQHQSREGTNDHRHR
ncbi:MAG: DNA-formamidopyrimidine glycosylase family protein [Bacteroidota bacterium]